MIDVTAWENKYLDCCGFYHGPNLPGFPVENGERIHERDIAAAAKLFVLAKLDQRDREEVYNVVYV